MRYNLILRDLGFAFFFEKWDPDFMIGECSRSDGRIADLDVSVDVDSVVLAGQDDGPVAGQGDIEALSMPDLALEGREKLK